WIFRLLFMLGLLLVQDWRVEYQQQHICAVKGSSVVIPCSFHYPETYKVQSVKWGHERCDIYKGPFIFDSESNDASSRFQYIGDKHHNCSFKIQQVEHNDTGKHAFRFVANSRNDQVKPWTGSVGSVLTVVNLEVVMTKPNGNRTTMEGDSVNLTCINSCDSENDVSAFIWFKNRELIHEGPAFYLSNISPANSGNYTCSLKSHKGTTSEVISIDVEYGPKNTSVSVRPSADAVAGSNITLTCSSHANPAVENYTWFKTNEQITVEAGKEPELYFREIFPHDGGQYFCSATNKYGSQNSSTVTLKVKGKLVKIVIILVVYLTLSCHFVRYILFHITLYTSKYNALMFSPCCSNKNETLFSG
uniref:Ig-like domain-containing protein n=1 Tax=Monopterus albus TaxID=43700 RepID=A0A3Q3RBQ9_MONAL